MADQTVRLMLEPDAGLETDMERLAEMTRQLRSELLELDVEDVGLVHTGEIPEGAKAGDPTVWGELFVTLSASGGILVTLVNLIQNWLTRHERCVVTVEIGGDRLEVQGRPSEVHQRLIDAWLASHGETVSAND
jgi:hypothetical protein